MTGAQYSSVAHWTLANMDAETAKNSLSAIREVFKNCGVAFPNGEISEVMRILMSDKYMGWENCTYRQAQEYANAGIAAVGIDGERIVIILPEEGERKRKVADINENAAKYVKQVSRISIAERMPMQFFAYYSANTTTIISDPEPHGNYLEYKTNVLHIDTDGVGSDHGNEFHQSQTSYMNGKLNADIHNYIVYPQNASNLSKMLGCVCVVEGPRGHAFGIVGDACDDKTPGEENYIDEVSWHMRESLGYPPANCNYGLENINFTIYIFPETKQRSWPEDRSLFDYRVSLAGMKYYY